MCDILFKEFKHVHIIYQSLMNDPIDKNLVLVKAVEDNNLDLVKILFETGADVTFVSGKCLLKASTNNNLDLIKFLVDNGADANNRGAIVNAAIRGHLGILQYMFDTEPDNLSYVNEALYYASSYPRLDIIKFLVECGADIVKDPSIINHALTNYCFDNVYYLVDSGAIVDVHNEQAILWAASHAGVKMIQFLIDHGADVRTTGVFSNACAHNTLEVIQFLYDYGADFMENEYYPFFAACRRADLDIVRYLIQIGAYDLETKRYILSIFASDERIELVKLLVDSNFVPDNQDILHETIEKLLKNKSITTLKYLLQKQIINEQTINFILEKYHYVDIQTCLNLI